MILDNLFTLTEGKKDPDELAKYEHDVTTLLAMGDVKTAKKVAGLSPDAAHRNRLRNIIRRHENNQGVAEGMPASVIKSKQRYAEMTPAEFAKAHGNKSDEELQAMAWRHGYGKSSNHYVDKRNKGRQGVAESRFEEPLTGWHIVSRAHDQVVRGTPSFATRDQAQKYLMTRMFANHQDFKVVHTAGVAEGLIGRLAAAGALVTGLGMAGHYLDRTAPKVSIQGNMAYVVPEDHGKIPPNALTLKGDDGITYRVWMSKRKDVFAYPIKDAQRTDEQGVAEGSMPYPHGKPEAGDKITWYHSNHYPSIEGTVVGWKDGHLIVKSIDPSPRNTEKTVVKYRVPKNNILSVEKQGVAEGEQSGLLEKQDACYHKVRSRYKVWPSAYASGALVQCRKKGAANWGTGGKKK